MERLQSALFFDNVPESWTKLAYPSTYSLAIWWVSFLSSVKKKKHGGCDEYVSCDVSVVQV